MKPKEILLWVVAIGALVVSLVAVIGPKGLKSDAAMRTSQISSVQNAGSIVAGTSTLRSCIQRAKQKASRCFLNSGTDAEEAMCDTVYRDDLVACAQTVEPIENNQ